MEEHQRRELEKLAFESRELERLPADWQEPNGLRPSQQDIDELASRYNTWFRAVANILPQPQLKQFTKQYTGSMGLLGIKNFLDNPLQINTMFKNWQHKYEPTYRLRIEKQRKLISVVAVTTPTDESTSSLSPVEAPATDAEDIAEVLETLFRIFGRFDDFSRVLARSSRDSITVELKNEHDLQVLVRAALRLQFDEVIPEESVPSFGGSSSRVDFFLKTVGVLVECKMTRGSHKASEIRDELIVDVAQYAGHPGCNALFCFIYDPNRLLDNPRTLRGDLESLNSSMPIRVQIDPS